MSRRALRREAGMSRSQIHRKLIALTGMAAGDFIRYLRLHRAMDLLRQNAATVAEISIWSDSTRRHISPSVSTSCSERPRVRSGAQSGSWTTTPAFLSACFPPGFPLGESPGRLVCLYCPVCLRSSSVHRLSRVSRALPCSPVCLSFHSVHPFPLHAHLFPACAPFPRMRTLSLHAHRFPACAPFPCMRTLSLHAHPFPACAPVPNACTYSPTALTFPPNLACLGTVLPMQRSS